MATAYVLLNTAIGSENNVLKALRKVEGVKEAFGLQGVYDVIAKVRAENMEQLNQIVNEGLQLSQVYSKLTIVLTET